MIETLHNGSISAGEIDHIAVAVPNLDQAIEMYKSKFGASVTDPIDVPEQGIRIAYAKFANACIEIMMPTRPDSPVGRFLDRNPKGGVHHFCLTTKNVDEAVQSAEANGMRLASKPIVGHHGRRLFFLHPADTIGSLIEMEEAD
jgi:methylmalonyl-CoA/ethylmalonyl-CoA epimerase